MRFSRPNVGCTITVFHLYVSPSSHNFLKEFEQKQAKEHSKGRVEPIDYYVAENGNSAKSKSK